MPEPQRETGRPYRILVVDDDPDTSRLVNMWFQGKSYEIFWAADGKTGLELARSRDPDLILLDLKMPGMDGIRVAKALKQDAKMRLTPVIVLTACRDVDAKVEAFAAGADDYVMKPCEFEEVDARIRSMLRRREFLTGLESKVEQLTHTNEQLEQLLIIDEKTGLYNFREFRRRLHDEWARAERYETPLSLLFLDVDNFKRINDTLGHPSGDRVLAEFATLVAGGARTSDVAARYGGEEFSVVLPHTDGPMAMRVADRIRRAVQDFVFVADERPTRITVSAGVATFPTTRGVTSVDSLVRAADVALYRAKDLGKNCVVSAEEGNGSRPKDHAASRRRAEEGPVTPGSPSD